MICILPLAKLWSKGTLASKCGRTPLELLSRLPSPTNHIRSS